MEHLTPPLSQQAQTRIQALCDDHLIREETLLADLLLSLRQVRDAFFQRKLYVLPALQAWQNQLAREATETAAARESIRTALADLLGVSVDEATLRTVAQSLLPPARERLLQRRAGLAALVREAEQLSQQNAVLLSYARGYFACLFAGLTNTANSECYSRQGERQIPLAPTLRAGTLLESQV